MSQSYLDGLLDELVPAESRDGWDDVLRRARRSQRRYVVLVAAVAVFVLAPATWATVKAFEGTPLPAPVRRTWNQTDREWAKGILAKHFPLAEVKKAHGVLRVKTKDGPYDLWAAPSTTGGICYLGALERDRHAGLQLDSTMACVQGHQEPPIFPGIAATHGFFENGSVTRAVLYGYVRGSETTVHVRMRRGRPLTLPVIEHFFLAAIGGNAAPVSITGRNAQGKVVARWKDTN